MSVIINLCNTRRNFPLVREQAITVQPNKLCYLSQFRCGLSGTLAVVFHIVESLPGFVVNGIVVEISGTPVDGGGTTTVVFAVCVEVSKIQLIQKLMIE